MAPECALTTSATARWKIQPSTWCVHQALGGRLEEVSSEGQTDIVSGGSLRARYRRFTMEVARPLSARREDYDESEYDELLAHPRRSLRSRVEGDYDESELLACFDDPTFRYIDCLWVAVWGKRPAG